MHAFVKPESSRLPPPTPTDLQYQADILPGVSRTFALTIPVLPDKLTAVVTNAYLLCRIADTIEDDTGLDNVQKSVFHTRFVAVVGGTEPDEPFTEELLPLLSSRVLPDERELIENTGKVIRVTHGFSAEERAAVTRCVSIMCSGMPEFQRNKGLRGLEDLDEMESYCYFVAGVVGEMLTELFCLHCPGLSERREQLMWLAVSFGQGLQMTNILKDIWDDRQADTCWLPRSVFSSGEFRMERLEEHHLSETFTQGLNELVGIAHAHLRNALKYTCLIPKREVGIRRFCLWAIGLAVLTLRKIHRNPSFTTGAEVKVSRRTVKATVMTTNMTLMSNRALRMMFDRAAGGLPLANVPLWAGQRNFGTPSEVP
ncbi:phytoene/squalene synthase family protein [Candidatus Rariloculus sp.]|uniref:phytoene/squalene synthase family protein n=1 Tax=Candidatus Rariloculus sp. TaxID=3101265 RepID=UPI003D0DB99C